MLETLLTIGVVYLVIVGVLFLIVFGLCIAMFIYTFKRMRESQERMDTTRKQRGL